ncbi:MAG: hypothetical protein PUF10_06375 [Bacteroidales bacterium]|nr:hypothetical protein [Bacteroidales bacterium]
MKKMILGLISIIIVINSMGQNTHVTLNLQQVEFKDGKLVQTLSQLITEERDCFKETDFYVLDFFQSSLSNRYYLSIDEFFPDNKTIGFITYYVTINNTVFFLSSKVSTDIIKILPSKKLFKLKSREDVLYVGGDYSFLIYKSLNGYYYILMRTCGE